MDSLPPPPPAIVADAPGDIYPRNVRERDLCTQASRPDYLYLGGLLALDVATFWGGVQAPIKYSESLVIRFTGPMMIGLTWGATVGGAWLALPKCSGEWVVESPREGRVRESWPLALSLAVLAGTTAPIINAIAFGNCNNPNVEKDAEGKPLKDPNGNPIGVGCIGGLPGNWTTFEREMHIVAGALAGFGGALLPYLLPPSTLVAARKLDRLRFGYDGRSGFVQYGLDF